MKKQGEILKSLRLEKGLTQEELGKIINQSKQTVYNWENDKRKCDVESLFKLAKFFDVTIDYLTGYSNDRKPKTDLSDSIELKNKALKSVIKEILYNKEKKRFAQFTLEVKFKI